MGQMAVTLTKRPQGSFSSNIKPNPKKQVNVIFLRSCRQLKQVQKENTDAESSEGAKDNNTDDKKKAEDRRDQ